MSNRQYDDTNRGALFGRNKRTTNSPDMGGDFLIGGDLLKYIMDEAQKGNQQIKVEMSAWRKMGRGNNPFMSISVSIPYAIRNPQAARSNQQGYPDGPPPQRGGGNFPQRGGGGGYGQRGGGGGYGQQSQPGNYNPQNSPYRPNDRSGGYGQQGGGDEPWDV